MDTQNENYEDSCVIFDNFGILVQLLLALSCGLALVYKRYYDPFRRPWIIWLMVF